MHEPVQPLALNAVLSCDKIGRESFLSVHPEGLEKAPPRQRSHAQRGTRDQRVSQETGKVHGRGPGLPVKTWVLRESDNLT